MPQDERCRVLEGPCATIIVRDDGFVELEQAKKASITMFQPYISNANYGLEPEFQAPKSAIAACGLAVMPTNPLMFAPFALIPLAIITDDNPPPNPTHAF